MHSTATIREVPKEDRVAGKDFEAPCEDEMKEGRPVTIKSMMTSTLGRRPNLDAQGARLPPAGVISPSHHNCFVACGFVPKILSLALAITSFFPLRSVIFSSNFKVTNNTCPTNVFAGEYPA
jgi:hypothetical protein